MAIDLALASAAVKRRITVPSAKSAIVAADFGLYLAQFGVFHEPHVGRVARRSSDYLPEPYCQHTDEYRHPEMPN